MKEKSEEFSENVKNGKNLKLLDYEKMIINIWQIFQITLLHVH